MKIHCFCLFAILLAVRQAAADELPAQKLLPKDTVMVVTVPDAPKGLGVLTNSSMGRLWRDPAVKAFKDKFLAKLQTSAVAPLERQLGVHFADYQGLAQGQITFAIVPVEHPATNEDHYNAVLLLDSKDHAPQLATNLAALQKKWIDAGKTLKTEKIRDIQFTTLMLSSDDFSLQKLLPDLADTNDVANVLSKPAAHKIELTVGQSGSLLFVSESARVIEKILARQDGGLLAGLDEEPSFQADFAARLRGAPFFFWFNPKPFLAELANPRTAEQGSEQPPASGATAAAGALATLGLTGLTSASIAYRDTPDGLSLQFFVGAPESGRRGLLQVFATEAKDCAPPPFVPADAVKFSRVRLDIPKSWHLLESTLNQISPTVTQSINYFLDIAGKAKDEKYDLRSELLGNLGDDIIEYERNPINTTLGDLREAPEIYLLGSPSPVKLAAALKVALGLLTTADKIKDREFLGRTIYSASLPNTPQGGSRTYHFAGGGGYVAITSDVEMLEEFLRSSDSDKPGLSRTPGLGEAAQKAGGGTSAGIFAFNHDKENGRVLLETLRKETISGPDLIGLLGLESRANKISTVEEANQFKDWFDFSLLPPFDTLAKYFNFSVYVGGFTPEGFSFNCFTPALPSSQ
jgi:hypothetical protein